MHRFNLKKGLRAVAIALICLPEPFTTILGLLLLAATFALFRQKSLSKFGDLEALVKKSLRNPEPAGLRRYFAAKKIVMNHLIQQGWPSQSAGQTEKPAANPAPAGYQAWFDNRMVSGAVLHHTLKTSFPQYEAEASPDSYGPEVKYHQLKLSLFPESTGPSESRFTKAVVPYPVPVLHQLKLS